MPSNMSTRKGGAARLPAALRPAVRRRRRRRGNKILHYIIFAIVIIAFAVVASLTFLFGIDEITVTGLDMHPEHEVIYATGIQIGDNLFRVPTADIERELLALFPYIETVQLHRGFPRSIEIRVEQSVPAAALALGDEFVLITRRGKVLERGLMLLEGDVLLVRGIDVSGREPGGFLGRFEPEPPRPGETAAQAGAREARDSSMQRQAEQEASGLIMINNLLDATYETGFAITNVDITNRLDMHIMYENRLLLRLGTDAYLPDKLLMLKAVFNELHPEAHGVLDASDYIANNRVIYTPAPGFRNDGSPIGYLSLGDPDSY